MEICLAFKFYSIFKISALYYLINFAEPIEYKLPNATLALLLLFNRKNLVL